MRLVFGFVILVLSHLVLGVDFGKQAATYEVVEEGFVSMIKSRLSYLNLQQHQEEMLRTARRQVLEPAPVVGIRATSKPREFFYDPSFTLTEDIKLPDGKILHKAGTKVNPLDHMVFDRELIFIDGRSQQQVEWLKQRLEKVEQKRAAENSTQMIVTQERQEEHNNLEIRIILVGGKILELQEDIGKTLYFDQGGELTGKFGIKQVPALVIQDAKKLMTSKMLDGEELDGFELYDIACQFCLGDEINNIFKESKEEGYPIEEYIRSATKLPNLKIFWYYHANVINVENPDPDMVSKFKKLAGDIEDKQVLYRYGIDCAVARGSKEAVEFFWNKLPNKDPESLIEAAINTKSSSYAPSHSYIAAFCVEQLDSYGQPDLFRKLIREDFIKNSSYHGSSSHVMNSFIQDHFYEHIEKVLKHLKPSDLPREEYEQLTWLTCKSIVSGPRAVFDQAVHFLTWLWDLPGYEKHKQYFQGCLETTDLADALGGLINIGVLEPVHKILDPASTLNTKLFTLTCREGDNVCYSLYTQNEEKLLQKLLGSIKTTVKKPTKKFLEKLDQEVLQKLESVLCDDKKLASHKGEGDSCASDNVSVSLQAFNFYKQYDRQSLEKILCNILGDAKGGKLLHKIDQVMSNKLGNMIANTQKSYKESIFYNSSDSDYHEDPQNDSNSLDFSVLVMGEGNVAEFTNS